MGAVLYGSLFALNHAFGDWLALAYWKKCGLFAVLCILGVASFGIMAKLTHIFDFNELRRLLPHKGKVNAEK